MLLLVGGGQVGIEAFDMDFRAFGQEVDQAGDFPFHEAQPVHAGVDVDVDRIVSSSCLAEFFPEARQGEQVGDTGLEPVADHLRVVVGARREYEDGQVDACLAEFHAFSGESDAEVGGAQLLHLAGEGDGAVAVAVGFDQDQDPGLRFEKGTEMLEVVFDTAAAEFKSRERGILCHCIQCY